MFPKTADQVYIHLRATTCALLYLTEYYLNTSLTYYHEEVKRYTSPLCIVPATSKASIHPTSSAPRYTRKSSRVAILIDKDSPKNYPIMKLNFCYSSKMNKN